MRKRLPKVFVCALMISTMTISSTTAAVITPSSGTTVVMETAASGEVSMAMETMVSEAQVNSSTVNEKELEAVIKEAKKKVEIPKEYTRFDFDLQTLSTTEKIWTLLWRDEVNNNYISVGMDQKNRVLSYYHYQGKEYWAGETAKYLKEELKEKAEEAVRKFAPDLTKKIEFTDATYTGVYDNGYRYEYVRKENGIKLPENYIAVVVNASTGDIQSVDINWLYDVKLPSVSNVIDKEKATKLLKENLKMYLSYHKNYTYWGKNSESKIFLAYEPDRNYIGVDALTGELYLEKYTWINTTNVSTEDAKADGAVAYTTSALTQEELTKIEEYKGLLSQEAAAKKISGNSALEFDKNLVIEDARLIRSYDKDNKAAYTWNFYFYDPRPVDYDNEKDQYRAYAYASVDASTGSILNYYTSLNTNYNEKSNIKIKYSKEESQRILEKFLKVQMKNRFENTKLSSNDFNYVIGYEGNKAIYGGYGFHYVRVNEGVEYPYNQISGSVNGLTGKIFEVYSNWEEDAVFESTKNAISAEKALNYYLGKEGYELVYEIHQKSQKNQSSYYQNVEKEVKLVYVPNINPSYISPFTGEQLDYKGDVYKEASAYSYKDIEVTGKTRNIALLADMGIGFEGELFKPQQEVTPAEVFQLLEQMGIYISEDHMLKNTLSVSREEMAYYAILGIGLEKTAKIPGIYRTGFDDEYVIHKDYVGAVALAKGLGIVGADGQNKFHPQNKLTRSELVDYIFAIIEGRNQLR